MYDVRDEESGEKRECRVIPWGRHEADGTVDDMWSILWKVAALSCFHVIFFVDNQSGHDNSVIVADVDSVSDFNLTNEARNALQKLENFEDPNVRGFWYCRIPGRQAHLAQWNLDHEGGRVENLATEGRSAHKFYRPRWPHHLQP